MNTKFDASGGADKVKIGTNAMLMKKHLLLVAHDLSKL